MTIYLDSNEPYVEAQQLIHATGVETVVAARNVAGWADYSWQDINGRWVNIERKTWPELLGGMDKVEDQLRRHKSNQPEARLVFVLEGLAVPNLAGTTTLKATNKDRVWVGGYSSSIRMSQVYAWLWQVGQYLEVFQTPTYSATITALVAFYKGDQKPEHSTFARPYKEMEYHPNSQVTQLMGMLPGIGPKRAEALIEKFTTVYNVVGASPAQLATVDGIGPGLSKTLLRRIGRPDV